MSGMFLPPSSSQSGSGSQLIVEHPLVSHEWIIESGLSYPNLIVYIKKKGDRVLDPPQVVTAFWENLTPNKIRISFNNIPCAGFVVLQG